MIGCLIYETQISPEDILWEGEDPDISHRGRGGPGRGIKKSMSHNGATGLGRGRGATKPQPRQEFHPSQNGIGKKGPDKIEILHTESLIKEVYPSDFSPFLSFKCKMIASPCIKQVERIFHGNHPDAGEMEKAKKLLKVSVVPLMIFQTLVFVF